MPRGSSVLNILEKEVYKDRPNETKECARALGYKLAERRATFTGWTGFVKTSMPLRDIARLCIVSELSEKDIGSSTYYFRLY